MEYIRELNQNKILKLISNEVFIIRKEENTREIKTWRKMTSVFRLNMIV